MFMAQVEVVELVCDLCEAKGEDAHVQTRNLAIDGKVSRELELCDGCATEYIDPLVAASRRIKKNGTA